MTAYPYILRKIRSFSEVIDFGRTSVVSRLFDWRGALVVAKPDTLIRWHRRGFRLFWRWNSKSVGRPALPKNPRVDSEDGG
jgi:hypothetical protein